MDDWYTRFYLTEVAELYDDPAEWVEEALAPHASAQLTWDGAVCHPGPGDDVSGAGVDVEEGRDVDVGGAIAAAPGADGVFVDFLISLDEWREDVLLSLQECKDLSLIHFFEPHCPIAYLNGGPNGVPEH